LRSEIEQRDLSLTQFTADLARRHEELAQLRAGIEQRDLDLDQLAGELAGRDEQLALTVEQLAAMEQSLEQACERSNQLLNSRSWRVTTPLRALSRWPKRVLLRSRRST
jgi:uncharacterized protein (DUF3084 family)